MLCSFFLLACLTAVVVLAVRPKLRRAVLDVAGGSAVQGAPRDAVPEEDPQTLEGVVSRQLVKGEITGAQYRHAMASIASRDATRHPLEVPDVPPRTDPPGTA
ncbi:hypothetical protein [Actinoplanes sp. NPDC049681]|uniref:hypothetical protein n=1 Tax=Actinoplanes sp. NPDC049681 TaxID=3363905 RepID=UPI0037A9CEE6